MECSRIRGKFFCCGAALWFCSAPSPFSPSPFRLVFFLCTHPVTVYIFSIYNLFWTIFCSEITDLLMSNSKPIFNLKIAELVDDTVDSVQSTARALVDGATSALSVFTPTKDANPSPQQSARNHVKCVILGDECTRPDRFHKNRSYVLIAVVSLIDWTSIISD